MPPLLSPSFCARRFLLLLIILPFLLPLRLPRQQPCAPPWSDQLKGMKPLPLSSLPSICLFLPSGRPLPASASLVVCMLVVLATGWPVRVE